MVELSFLARPEYHDPRDSRVCSQMFHHVNNAKAISMVINLQDHDPDSSQVKRRQTLSIYKKNFSHITAEDL